MKIGSLFDGAGGFPYAATLCGLEPAWASEIEPLPVRVTKKNLPGMRHLGDVTKIDGGAVEPVDVITFGSPCQDLSIAGPRTGLAGERSGLFLEAIRIIKEMRKKTNGRCPTFAIWENVPGAFSSHKGEDFRIVLQELANVADERAYVPRPAERRGGGHCLENCRTHPGRWILDRLESLGRSILGSPPKTSKNLSCGRF